MKVKLIFVVIISSLKIYSQSISNGMYCTIKKDVGFETNFFNFYDLNKFKFLSYGCTGSEFGMGIYEVDKDSIHFKFKECKNCRQGIQIKTIAGESDSVKIDLKISDETGGLPGANCFIRETKQGFTSDINGNLKGNFLKTQNDLTLVVSFIGFGEIEMKISSDTSELSGSIKMDHHYIIDSKKMSFKIMKITKNRITFSGTSKNYRHDRVRKSQVVKRIKENAGESDFKFQLEQFL